MSANSRLRAELKARGDAREMPTFVPSLALSTDNAAMIAAAGPAEVPAGSASLDLNADAALALVNLRHWNWPIGHGPVDDASHAR